MTGTAWSSRWGGICCVCSLLLPLPILAGSDAAADWGRVCHWPPYLPPSRLSPLSAHPLATRLTQSLGRPFGGMSCPKRHCITAVQPASPEGCSDSDHERAEFWVSGLLWRLCPRWPVSEWDGKVTTPPNISPAWCIFLLQPFLRSPLTLPWLWSLFKALH